MSKTRTSITLEDDVLMEIKIIALKEKTSMNQILEKAVIEFLKKRKEKGDEK